MSVLAALRAATRPAHDELEVGLDVFRRLEAPADRWDLLMEFHALYESAEAALLPWLEDVADLDYASRLKLPQLQADLLALHAPATAIVPALRPAFRNRAHALGFAYVLEGSSLGGRVIFKQLRASGQGLTGLGFFDVYGDRTGPLWQTFCEVLERECAGSPSEAVLGAKEGFAYMSAGLLQAA